MKRIVESFNLKDNIGNVYPVDIWEEIIDAGTLNNPDAVIPGMQEVVLSDGRRVNDRGDGTFYLFREGVVLSRIL
jgi:hypothetical protein